MGTGNGIYSEQWTRRAGILTTSSARLATVLRLPADHNKQKIADDSDLPVKRSLAPCLLL